MPDRENAVLSGTVDTIIYQNEENGYTVCGIETPDGDQHIAVGTLPYLTEGDQITAYGTFLNHPTYGRQFKVSSFEKHLPTEETDILKYLSSGAVKGIGPKTAVRIVERFGSDTFDIIENHPDWLAEINGISQRRARAISEQFKEVAGARQVMMFCREYFSATTTMRIYKKWGASSVDRIRRNPYHLCEEFYGIGFSRADQIAAACGIAADDGNRIAGGLTHILTAEAQRNGHTCLPEKELLAAADELLGGLPEETVYQKLLELLADGKLVSIVREGKTLVSLPLYNRAETFIARKMKQLEKLCPSLDIEDARRLILQVENDTGLTYASLQREALLTALSCGIMILTGGPGTGKTTVIKGLISIFSSLGMDVALAAPTGRAAKRMSEATSYEAKTLHRLLEMERNDDLEPKFQRGEKNLLDEQVFIIDEASMIDVLLMNAFLRAVRPGAKIILIGDSEQLPSVGAGNLLGDLIASEVFPTVRLTEIFRQSAESLIILNAHAIKEGYFPDITVKDKDFFFLGRRYDEDIAQTVVDLCKTRLPRSYGGAAVQSKIQIITPSHKGAAGTEQLNALLQAALNPPAPYKSEKNVRSLCFREGDRVMQMRNNYELEWDKGDQSGVGVFNGDIGVIRQIHHSEEYMLISFDDRLVRYDFSALEDLEHAYAITVHKSQGCEYPIVILPLFNCAPMLQTRNLLYTAVTRAGKMVILVGRNDILQHMVENNRHAWRCTSLPHYLQEFSE